MKVANRILGLAAAGMLGLSVSAQAQELQFQGSTNGCFYAANESPCTPSASSSLLFLSFANSTFNVTSVAGLAGIGAAPGSPNVNNLGSVSVTGDASTYTGGNFLLDVIFSQPTITSATSVFTASVKGSVQSYANGLVKIVFDPASQVFDFQTGEQVGSFLLTVNNVSLTPGSTVALTGDIEVTSLTTTPEPATMALMMTGLGGLVPMVRRRRKGSPE